ncbi:DMT family transporter [Sulfitobacter sp. HNIBRBA2951]|uniref:DMT family transporter n=1 Tax=Sulfitobacter aquimarinus TaxID=3158557 RepID=UPI0032DF623B
MQRAVLIMFLAMSMIPAGDSAGKLLSGTYAVAPLFVAWSRFAIGALLIAPFAPRSAWGLLRDWRIWLRACVLAAGISCIQTALQTEEIATVFAAFFIGPLVSYVLAVIFLREPVTTARTALVVAGFIGVLIVVRPGMGASAGVLWAVAAGCCYGVFLTMSRWLGALGTPIAMTFIQLLIAALLLAPFGMLHLPQMSGAISALTATSALFSMLGNLLLLYAYGLAPATRLAPLVYFQLVAAVALGWLIFGDLPDMWTWLGLAVILGAGLASARLR